MITLALAAMLVVPMAGGAANGNGNGNGNGNDKGKGDAKALAFVPDSLLAAAAANPLGSFNVIIQGRHDRTSNDTGNDVQNENGKVKRKFSRALDGSIEATITGKQLLKLATNSHVEAITRNVTVKATSYQDSTMWQDSTDLTMLQSAVDPVSGAVTAAPQAPAIAVVDSGVQPGSDFGGRLIASVTLCSLCTDSAADAEGHGTMVASIAAGAGTYAGGAQNAPIVSIRTANADGQSKTSDVVAAADWILAHAQEYNIRVANFSLAGASDTSIRVDPLDRAVESLWLNGIVVVTAAGNHGVAGSTVNMSYAPGNDPFVITVGALDQNGTSDPSDDTLAPWSANGKTMDGFTKPDISAPGRWMVARVPMDSTLVKAAPDRVVAPGYMWMSGTSFSTPVVSAAAAQLLARHPSWTPDQVKGALMLAANYLPSVTGFSGGVGEVDAGVAASIENPPNPNVGLYQFVGKDPVSGSPAFDAASWASYLKTGASWAQASWAEASWAEASWSSASWASASWSSASWSSNIDSMMASMASMAE
jgi:serine protease AprX